MSVVFCAKCNGNGCIFDEKEQRQPTDQSHRCSYIIIYIYGQCPLKIT